MLFPQTFKRGTLIFSLLITAMQGHFRHMKGERGLPKLALLSAEFHFSLLNHQGLAVTHEHFSLLYSR